MASETRAELAARLDDDIDSFMETMAANKKDKSTPAPLPDVDTWWANMQSEHAIFMDDTAVDGAGELPADLAALQALKYENESGISPADLAEQRRAEGNKHFQYKKYKTAITCYTQGLQAKCPDTALNVKLLNNRAAAHFHIGNYRSSLRDCQWALRADTATTNLKVILRGAQCLLRTNRASTGRTWLTSMLDDDEFACLDETDKEKVVALRKELERATKVEQRDSRKTSAKDTKEQTRVRELYTELVARNYSMRPPLPSSFERFDPSIVDVNIPQMDRVCRVGLSALGEAHELCWPCLFVYEAATQTDFVREFAEATAMSAQLDEVLLESPPWDTQGVYRRDNVVLQSVDADDARFTVKISATLGEVLGAKRRRPLITNGLVMFFVVPK